MELLVAYDVDTTTPEGRRRLRQVARVCEKYGQRVQQSVFEVVIAATEYVHFTASLEKLVTEADNLRIYTLHKGTLASATALMKSIHIPEGDPWIL